MAVFNNLHQVGRNLVDLLLSRLAVTDVQVGPPPDTGVSATESIRITLLWLTPQPGHRNDPPEMGAAGQVRPPVTLSACYLISTYGSSGEDPIQAHNLLGQTLQVFHTVPVMELPDAIVPLTGEGRLAVVHVPTDADLMEKVYSSLQVGMRPWALVEVAPIQLRHLGANLPVHPVVRPGGVQLGPVEAMTPPSIERVTPSTARQNGVVRIDATYQGVPSVAVGGAPLPPAAVTVVGDAIFVDLATVGPNSYDVTLSAGSLTSLSAYLTVASPPAASVDAPNPGFHSMGSGDLALTGQDLAAADRVILWPDEGLAAPSEVVTLSPVVAAATSVSVAQAVVQAASLRPAVYRVTAGVGPHTYTPWVLLEMRP